MRSYFPAPGAACAVLVRALLVPVLLVPALLVSALLAAPPAGAQSVERLQREVNEIERDLAEVRARLGMPATGGGGAVSDLILRIDRLEEQIRELTGKVERLEFEQRRIAEDAARRFSDIEFRLTELEGGDISSLAPVPPLGEGGGEAEAAQAAVSVSERSDLDRAVEHVRQGRYDLAEDQLRNFISTYPESPLEGEAQYWLGESQFVRGAYQNAARSYLAGYKADRSGPAAARNLMKLGVTLGRLGQVNEACLTLREVPRQFPQAPAEVLGRTQEELDALACG